MSDKFDYYSAPPQEVFEDIKKCATDIWNTYSDQFGYRSEKLDRIKDLENVSDNAWYIVAMFDGSNQAKLFMRVKPETRVYLLKIYNQ